MSSGPVFAARLKGLDPLLRRLRAAATPPVTPAAAGVAGRTPGAGSGPVPAP
ncbi:hypothetical protein [Ancylobacter lacus]|uniref:hypothetical protein n=1 Tax=Ancylobacter lacus TaxID=2579970 RepID=UPI001BCF6A23|nr:hypothetical protein [Ancylobacter lacus]MBS7539382.1 hypothetical protein [Ancylobacter lacus]